MSALKTSTLLPCLFLTLLFALPSICGAQVLRTQPTPFSVWLDFTALSSANPPKVALPIWLESVQSDPLLGVDGKVVRTNFRLRFRAVGDLNRQLLFRLFFEDLKSAPPTLTGVSARGEILFERGPLGSGLNLPISETFALPMTGVAAIDIMVAGDGSNIRGAFAASLRKGESLYPLDFAAPATLLDGFENLPALQPAEDDFFLNDRVKATLDPGVVKFTPRESTGGTWEFSLETPPLVAVLTFEILNADPLAPLEVWVNDHPLGATATHQPDLADPGYQGVLRPIDRGVSFRYAGWLRAQKALPGSALHAGENKIELRLPGESGPVAVRGLELQLKNRWSKEDSDPTLSPTP